MQLLLYRRIFHVPVKLRLFRNTDACHLLEEPARSFIQAHGSFPSGGFVDGCSEMHDGVIQARRRPVAAGAFAIIEIRVELSVWWKQLRTVFCRLLPEHRAFIQRVFASNFVPMLFPP